MGFVKKDIGKMFFTGFEGCDYNDQVDELISQYQVGGFILFKRNIEVGNRQRLLSLINKIYQRYQELNLPKPLMMIDHEGGRVHRLPELSTHFPAPGNLNHLDAGTIHKVYLQQGREITFYGFNVILGPVIDLCPASDTKSHIADRSFGMNNERVIQQVKIAIAGIEQAGLIAVPKHFPGYGEAEIDPHFALPSNNVPISKLKDTYLRPFQAVIEQGASCIMSAHILNKEVDAEYPATISPKWLSYLRNDMGFKGIIISDDLCMKSIWDRYSPQKYLKLGINAGINMFLICHITGEFDGSFAKAYQEAERLFTEPGYNQKMQDSIGKITQLQQRLKNFKRWQDDSIFTQGQELLRNLVFQSRAFSAGQ